jgi:tetratricopeptide (TPR) repeat protein
MAGWHPVERTLVSAVEALLLSRAGAHDQAEKRARAAVATAETETDNVWLQGWSNEVLAFVLEHAGRVDEAQEALKRALTIWERKHCLPYVRRVREHVESLRQAQV